MKKKDALIIILAIAGTALVWFPILAPAVHSLAIFLRARVFRFDYLMPAELFPAALVGGCLLFTAAWRARSRRGLIGGGFGIAAGSLMGGQVLAVATGLASGEAEPSGLAWVLVLASIVAYNAALVLVGIGEVFLLRDLFLNPKPPAVSP